MQALRDLGAEAEWLRWWESDQQTDIIHFFGRLPASYVTFAQQKGIKVVLADLLTSQGSRNAIQRIPHWGLRQMNRLLGGRIGSRLGWEAYRLADACIALTPWEARLMHAMFEAPINRIHVIPNGVEQVFFRSTRAEHRAGGGGYLVCTATITERKRVLELAEAALAADVPVWIVGRPYSESGPYFRKFLDLHRKAPEIVRFEGPISNRSRLAEIYSRSRGFVLLSTMESLSLSALEAAASGCPLLLSDLPWARCTFGDRARYCAVTSSTARTSACLKSFWENAPSMPLPDPPATWKDVARQLMAIYEALAG